MGSPNPEKLPKAKGKKKSRRGTPQPEVAPPTLVEKLSLLNLRNYLGWSSDGKLTFVKALESMKDYLLPLVQWLDVDLACVEPFNWGGYPHELPIRAMVVFRQRTLMPAFALSRKGEWLVKRDTQRCKAMSSAELASAIEASQRAYVDAKFSRAAVTALQLEAFFEKNSALAAIVNRHYAIWVIGKCFEELNQQLAAREQRLAVMRERINMLADFGKSLDPLIAQGRNVPLDTFYILRENDHGSLNMAGSYLCTEALDPFRAIASSDSSAKRRYSTVCEDRSADSLEKFLGVVTFLLREVIETQQDGQTSAQSIWGRQGLRLPFTERELQILRDKAESIIHDH